MYMNIFLFNGYLLYARANSTHPILWLESKTSLRSFVIFQIFFPRSTTFSLILNNSLEWLHQGIKRGP